MEMVVRRVGLREKEEGGMRITTSPLSVLLFL